MTFSKLIEHNMKNIFLKESYTKYFVETSPRPFSEKLKLSMFESLKFHTILHKVCQV